MDYGVDCTLKGLKCYKASCMETGECALAHAALDRILHSTATTCADSTTTGDAAVLPMTNAQEHCHYGLYPIGKAGKAQIWVGREAAISNSIRNGGAIEPRREPVSLIINCAGDAPWALPAERAGTVVGNSGAKKVLPGVLFDEHVPTPQIVVDWPDYGIPTLDRHWWVRLNAALRKIAGDVIVHCLGGHGRTGTAASILAVMNGWNGEKCPVTWLREVYCRQVVECQEQIDYITRITGAKITARPRGWQSAGQRTVTWTPVAKRKPTMSIRKYKKWRRDWAKLYPKGKFPPESVEDLMRGGNKRVVMVDGEWWRFDPATKTFTWLDNTRAGPL